MQALDSFMSPVPSFDDDIPISAVLVLALSPGNEPTSDPSAGASASASKTQVGNWKAAKNPTPQKKARKTTGRSAGRMNLHSKLMLRHLHNVLGG
jgi:hypothetical protein